jgi:hypothetical protein
MKLAFIFLRETHRRFEDLRAIIHGVEFDSEFFPAAERKNKIPLLSRMRETEESKQASKQAGTTRIRIIALIPIHT